MRRWPRSCPACGVKLQRTPTGGPGLPAHYRVVHPDRDLVADLPWLVDAYGPLLAGLVEGAPMDQPEDED